MRRLSPVAWLVSDDIRWEEVLLAGSVLLYRAATGGGGNVYVSAAVCALFGLGLLRLLVRQPLLDLTSGPLLLLYAFIALDCVALFRAVQAGSVETATGAITTSCATVLLVAVAVVSLQSATSVREWRGRLLAILCAPSVDVAANVVLHLAHVQSPGAVAAASQQETTATMLGLVGIHTTRVLFPLSQGVNAFGGIAGLALAISLVGLRLLTGPARKLAGLSSMVTLYALLAVDSRDGLFFALAAAALVLMATRISTRGAGFAPLFLPVAPSAVLGGLGLVSSLGLAAGLSRSGGDNVATATGRSAIWQVVLDFLTQHPALKQLVGYGAYGHVTSEVSYSYAYVYQGYVDPQNNPAQNFLLQTVLDTGYVGAAIAVALLSVALLLAARRVRGRSRDPLFVATLAGLLFLGLLGVLEASPMIYNTDAFGAFLLLVVSAIVVPAGLAVDSRSRAPVGSARLV
jgi:hypothetical protein